MLAGVPSSRASAASTSAGPADSAARRTTSTPVISGSCAPATAASSSSAIAGEGVWCTIRSRATGPCCRPSGWRRGDRRNVTLPALSCRNVTLPALSCRNVTLPALGCSNVTLPALSRSNVTLLQPPPRTTGSSAAAQQALHLRPQARQPLGHPPTGRGDVVVGRLDDLQVRLELRLRARRPHHQPLPLAPEHQHVGGRALHRPQIGRAHV